MLIIKLVILYTGLIVSVYTDTKYRKIKNFIVFPMMACGIFLSFENGIKGFGQCLLSILLIFIICSIFCVTGMLGYGDKKLLCAISSLFGFLPGLNVMFMSLAAMLIYMVLAHPIRTLNILKNFLLHLKLSILKQGMEHYEVTYINWTMPFANFIAAGTVLYQIFFMIEGRGIIQ